MRCKLFLANEWNENWGKFKPNASECKVNINPMSEWKGRKNSLISNV